MPKPLGFQTKLSAATTAIVVVTIMCLSIIQAILTRQGYEERGRETLAKVAATLGQALTLQDNQARRAIAADVDILATHFELSGFPVPEVLMDVTMNLTDQDSGQTIEATFPALKHGQHYLHENTAVVTKVAALTGATASILQLHGEGFIRVSSSATQGWGQGTVLPLTHPAGAELAVGRPYSGLMRLGNAWYLTALRPMRDLSGTVIGALEVVRPLISPDFAAFARDVRVDGHGGTFAVDAQGALVISGPQAETILPAVVVHAEPHFTGAVQLPDGGTINVVCQDFAPWNLRFVTWVDREALMTGVNGQLVQSALLSAGLPLAISLLLIGLVGRQLLRPVRRLATLCEDVVRGNFDFPIFYHAQDALGQTIRAVHGMVAELKHKLGFGQGVLNGVIIPCVVVDTDNRIVHVNASALEVIGHEGEPTAFLGQTMNTFAYADATNQTLTQRAMATRQQVQEEITIPHVRQQTIAHLRVVATPIYDLDAVLIGAMAIWINLSEEKATQAHIQAQHRAIAQAAMEAERISRQVTAAAMDLEKSTQLSRCGAQEQQDKISCATMAMERMQASLTQVDEKTRTTTELARQAVTSANSGRAMVRNSMDVMDHVAAQAQGLQADLLRLDETARSISRIMNMIDDIADQTNLLALNAAIEAARAGQAGRGFAVVADEVRKLAEKTMAATRDVDAFVGTIQRQVGDNITTAAETNASMLRCRDLVHESGSALEAIVEVVSVSATQIDDIAQAVALQRAAGTQVLAITDEIATIATHNVQAMAESSQAVETLNDLARRLLHSMGSINSAEHQLEELEKPAQPVPTIREHQTFYTRPSVGEETDAAA